MPFSQSSSYLLFALDSADAVRKILTSAFGSTYEEFEELIYMPEPFITKRKDNADKIEQWRHIYRNLADAEKQQFIELIKNNSFPDVYIENEEIRLLYSWYMK